MTTKAETIRPTAAVLRRVAFVDMLRGPASRTYGGCDYVFTLRDRTGSVLAIIDGNTRSTRWSSPSSLVRTIGEFCGREPRGGMILDLESNRDLRELERRYPSMNGLAHAPARYQLDYSSGSRGFSRI